MRSVYRDRCFQALGAVVAITLCVGAASAWSIARLPPSPSATSRANDVPLTEHPVGGGPDGGAVYSLAVAATRPPTVFAAFEYGGVFKSIDQGGTWIPADRGLPVDESCELVADPVNPTVIYGTCGDGLFRTANGGAIWRQLDVDHAVSPVIAPSDSRVVYEPPMFQVVRSRDSGRHWEAVGQNNAVCVQAFAIDPADPFVLYCGVDRAVNRSRDGGETWASFGRALPAGADEIDLLAIDPSDSRTMYAATWSGGLYKTTTAGALWFSIGERLSTEPIKRLKFADISGDILVAQQGSTIVRSVDAGDHWTTIVDATSDATLNDFAIDPVSSSTVYVATDTGVRVTTDLGMHWQSRSRGIARATTQVAMLEGPTPTLVSNANSSLFSSVDGGTTWKPLHGGAALDGTTVTAMSSDGAGGVLVTTRAGRFQLQRGKTAWTPLLPSTLQNLR